MMVKQWLNNGKKMILKYRHQIEAVTYPIIKHPKEVFEVVATVKDANWEKTYYSECYGHNKEQQLEVFSPEDLIFKIPEGIVSESTDVVITEKGALWNRYNEEEFVTYLIPADGCVISYNRDTLKMKKLGTVENIAGCVIPMIGVGASHWVHSIFEFLPRLFSAGEAGILDKPVTVLVSDKLDHTIREIMQNYLEKFPEVCLKSVQCNVAYKCETLYFQPVVGPGNSGYKFRLDYPWHIPDYIVRQADQYIVNPVVGKIRNNKPKYDKIFLGRSAKFAKNGRTLLNYEEVYQYFLDQGFVDIEGSTLTLTEKAEIFYHAKEIVTLHGSSNMNLTFCNQAKCMILGNYRFATDPVFYPFIKQKLSTCIYVTGQDESSEFHSSYYIPLDKIKKAYQERIAH